MHSTAWIITCSICSNKFSIERQRLLSMGATIVCPVCDNVNSTQSAILGPSDGILTFPYLEKTLPSSNNVIQNFVQRKALPQKAPLPSVVKQSAPTQNNHEQPDPFFSTKTTEKSAPFTEQKSQPSSQSITDLPITDININHNEIVSNNQDDSHEQCLGRPVRPVAIKTVVLPHEKKNQDHTQLELTDFFSQNNESPNLNKNEQSIFSKIKPLIRNNKNEDLALKERLSTKLKQAALEREKEKLELQGFEVISESPFSTLKKEKNNLALKLAFSINLIVFFIFSSIVFKEELLTNHTINFFANNICQKINCILPAPQNSKSFILEDSNFEQVAPNLLKFELSLKNSNKITLLAPSVEVILQDSIGNTVAKTKLPSSQWSNQKTIEALNSTKQTLFLNVDTSKVDNFQVKIVD